MIEIEILKSPDKDQTGTIVFHKDIIYVGNDYSCDLFIQDKDLKKSHLIFEINGNDLFVHLQTDIDHIHINNKRYNKNRKLQINDRIKIGSTEMVIKNFSKVPSKSYKQHLNEITDDLISSKSPLLEIIELIQQNNL